MKHVCSTTQLLAPTVDAELEFALSHMHGEPMSVVEFPQFTDSVGSANSPDYCGPRTYTVTTEDKKEVLEVEYTSAARSDTTTQFIEWPADSDIYVKPSYPFNTLSEPSYDFFKSEVINTANPGQEQVQLTINHSDAYINARQKVTISVELAFYPLVTAKSDFKATLRQSCFERMYALVSSEFDGAGVEVHEPYYVRSYVAS